MCWLTNEDLLIEKKRMRTWNKLEDDDDYNNNKTKTNFAGALITIMMEIMM